MTGIDLCDLCLVISRLTLLNGIKIQLNGTKTAVNGIQIQLMNILGSALSSLPLTFWSRRLCELETEATKKPISCVISLLIFSFINSCTPDTTEIIQAI